MCRKLLLVVLVLAMSAALCAQSALAQTICQLGDTGVEVRVLQTRLCTLGYLAGEPVAPYKFDAKTKIAVKKFQAASGLAESEAKATGAVDDVTYDRVKRSDAVSYDAYKDKLHTKGGSGEEVLETKTRLKKLGYINGALTNQYDQTTVTAVGCFQRANGLYDSGNADKATRTVLFLDRAVSMRAYQEAANLSIIRKGDTGDQVIVVQQQLASMGYYSSDLSGTFNVATVAAVKTFQTANGLSSTGIADLTTREILNSGRAKSFHEYTSEQMLVVVSKGNSGYPVELLQDRLKVLYYYGGKVTGSFDTATVNAVKLFQKGNSLSQTGTATVQTREAMNAASAIDRLHSIGLMTGDDLDAVKDMTTRLKALGFIAGATSKYNKTVTASIKLFQKANALTVTGTADPATLDELYSSDVVSYDEYTNGTGNAKIEQMIKIAYKYLGVPYRTGSACKVPNSFDCSRYTKFIFGKMGVNISGEVQTQGTSAANKWGAIKDINDLKRGDLLFFDTQEDKRIGHSAIYLGKNNRGMPQFIHASSAAGKVVVSDFSDWYRTRFVHGARVWR